MQIKSDVFDNKYEIHILFDKNRGEGDVMKVTKCILAILPCSQLLVILCTTLAMLIDVFGRYQVIIVHLHDNYEYDDMTRILIMLKLSSG